MDDGRLMTGWLTTAEAARVVGLSAERIRQLAKAGHVPALDTPHGRLFRQEDIEALRDRRAQQA